MISNLTGRHDQSTQTTTFYYTSNKGSPTDKPM